MSDLRACNSLLKEGGYWLHVVEYAYGYPMFEVPYSNSRNATGGVGERAPDFVSARPGYDVRTLMAAANVLAAHGAPRVQPVCRRLRGGCRDTPAAAQTQHHR